MEQIFGHIERITFHNPENGFTVARLRQPRQKDLTTIIGNFPSLQEGEHLRCKGKWKTDPTHGVQFEVSEWHSELPCDPVGIQRYLESGMVRGVGPIYAARIVDKFKEKTLDVIDQSPEVLLTVEGIGEKRLDKIKESWKAQKAIREVMIFLQKYGISSAFAQKIYKTYGDETTDRLKENPYQLAAHIRGVGFKMADTLAKEMGFDAESCFRIDAGILFTLQELSDEGHVCYPLPSFLPAASELLGVSPSQIEERLPLLAQTEKIALEDGFIWLKRFYVFEKGIAEELRRISSSSSPLRAIDTEKAVNWAEEKLKIRLALNQKEAVKHSLVEKIHIITGGPGTGKSTITKAILAITSALTNRIILAAPTGRAAKRLSEITRRKAFTIHSLLQFDFTLGTFKRNRQDPLECDLLVVDEASMIDTPLMYYLLRALPSHARLLLVGDIFQLPSVGPGNVLKDFIESQAIPVSALNQIFRQAAGSKIIVNAHRINSGEFPFIQWEPKSDFLFIPAETPEEILSEVIHQVTTRLPKERGFDAREDIQVLSPMKKGAIGIENLNQALQKALNGNASSIPFRGSSYGVNDKVIQLRNNYNKEVFNGDIGIIEKVDKEEQTLHIRYDEKSVPYHFTELDEISLAYATSVHKYQGSERRCVVIPIHPCHYMMLSRNLLYTAVTRGKNFVVLIGSKRAIGMAVSNDKVQLRHTRLGHWIKRLIASKQS